MDLLPQKRQEQKQQSENYLKILRTSVTVTNILKSFPTPQEYLVAANPDAISKKYISLTSKSRAYDIRVPRLEDIEAAYGHDAIIMFLRGWLLKLNRWVNVSEEKKLDVPQIDELSNMLYNDHKRLKTSELSLCFTLIKKGDYGDFYGSISPTMIVKAFKKYVEDRNKTFEVKERNNIIDFNKRAGEIMKAIEK